MAKPPSKISFKSFANATSCAAGHPVAFAVAVAIIVIWIITGPMFHYSDTWQLVINTGTSVTTFLMVFLVQSTQNRDSTAVHLKLDELIRAIENAQNQMLNLEDLDDEELAAIRQKYVKMADKATDALADGDTAVKTQQ